jgi:hypothetical protein
MSATTAPSHTPNFDHAGYMRAVVITDNLRQNVKNCVRALRKMEFDAIAFRGMSGALLAPAVALSMKKNLLMVRKPADDSHSMMMVEGDKAARRYVIIDDLISTGATVRTIFKEIREFAPQAECIGCLEAHYLFIDAEENFGKAKGDHFATRWLDKAREMYPPPVVKVPLVIQQYTDFYKTPMMLLPASEGSF